MQACNLLLETPRGTLKIHTVFESTEEAASHGWGVWFNFENYTVLGRDNRVGAVVLTKPM